jgi:hypothetical protein
MNERKLEAAYFTAMGGKRGGMVFLAGPNHHGLWRLPNRCFRNLSAAIYVMATAVGAV